MFKLGIDIVEIARFENKSDDYLKLMFTSAEMNEAGKRENKAEFYASRFAAKEAFAKTQDEAFSTINAKHINVETNEKGMPYISLDSEYEHLLSGYNHTLSISHEKTFAIAVVALYAKS